MTALRLVDTQPKDFSPSPITDAEAQASFRAAVNLFEKWALTDDQAATLLDLPVRSYRRWKSGEIGRIDRDRVRGSVKHGGQRSGPTQGVRRDAPGMARRPCSKRYG